jgi:LacI family transcriptional regulator
VETAPNQTNRATIRDIARHAGVSVATVSRVINGRPDVAPETREAVLRHVRTHNFSTNRSARALSVGRTGLVGFTVPNTHAEYFANILSGATEALYEQDMRVVLCPTEHEHERELTLLDKLMQGTTDGAILLLPTETNDELRALQSAGFQFVVVDPRHALDEGIPAVSSSHWAGAKAAAEHLLELGHRRIGLITGERGWVAAEDRIAGYHTGLIAAGVVPTPELIAEGDFLVDSGRNAALRLLDLPDPPTAILSSNDNMAVGAMQAARARGLAVPDDLSVVGYDDLEKAGIVTPPLTTVRQPLAELGRTAVSLLMRLVEGQRVEALHVELAAKLVVRETTAPPRR